MACSARQLVASIDGSHKEEEHRGEFVGQVLGEALGGGQRRRSVDQPAEPGGESAAGRRQTVPADFARVRAVPQGETVLQDRLHLACPGTVGMSGLQVLGPSQEVSQARLLRRFLEAAIGHPPVPLTRLRMLLSPHNLYLTLLGEAGIVPLLLFVSALVLLLRAQWGAPRSPARDATVAWVIVIALYCMSFDHLLGISVFMFLAGLSVATGTAHDDGGRHVAEA